jgi:hypothetical protein
VIPQTLAVEQQLVRIEGATLPTVRTFRGNKGYCYGAYAVRVRLSDSAGVERSSKGLFYSMDIDNNALILGRP